MPSKFALQFSIFTIVVVLIGTPIAWLVSLPQTGLEAVLMIILPLMALTLPMTTIAAWAHQKWLMKKYCEASEQP